MKLRSQQAADVPGLPARPATPHRPVCGSLLSRVASALRVVAVASLLALATGGAAQPRVVVSIPPYVDLVERLAGPSAQVTALLPAGASPHGYEPTPRDLERLHRADLVVLNGGLDEWLLDLVVAADEGLPVFEVLDAIPDDAYLADEPPPVVGGGGDDADHETEHAHEHADEHHENEHEHADENREDEHDHGDRNPHVWLDPLLVARAVPALAAALDQVDPEGAPERAEAAASLIQDLHALHGELQETLAGIAGAPFVPFHDAWPHFAARYGLDLVLEIEPFPGREPSARALAQAVRAVRETGARAIFAEAQLSDRPARVLADEAGVRMAVLDPVGGTEALATYESLLRHNAATLVGALSER